MLTPPEFGTFQHAYLAVLRHLIDNCEYRAAGRGNPAWESTNISFRLTRPTDRTPYLAARRTNIVFNYAEALWYLTGGDDLDMIAYYAPRLRMLSTDGRRLTGTAYGPRLFAPAAPDAVSQFDRVVELLRVDPDSKRAVMLVMRPDELAEFGNPDVACTLGLQLMLRAGRLHLTGYMRGNDAVVGLLCDTFSFTFIQEFAARLLNVQVGTYTHHVGSMHINVADLPRVNAMLTEHDQAPANHGYPVDPMPGTRWADLRHVLIYERALRTNSVRLTPGKAADLPLDRYWQRVLLLFEIYRQISHQPHTPVDADTLAALHPGHRWLIAQRWPERMPTTAAPAQP